MNGVDPDEASDEQGRCDVSTRGVDTSLLPSSLDMEPFDEGLNFKVWAMDNERHAWDGKLAELRRNGPQKLREITEEVLRSEHAAEYQLPSMDVDEEMVAYSGQLLCKCRLDWR